MTSGDDLPGMLALAKAVAAQKFPHTMDARVWAVEFAKLNSTPDEGTMIAWFANAIMAGYDTASSRLSKDNEVLRKALEYIEYNTPGGISLVARALNQTQGEG